MRFQVKGSASLLLAMTFLMLSISGIILYLTPRGRVANWTGWTMLGLEKSEWQAVHTNMALLFLIVAGLHLYLNWPIFWSYLKKKHSFAVNLKLEMAAAFLLVGGVSLGSILEIPPFSSVMAINHQIKDFWEGTPAGTPSPCTHEVNGVKRSSVTDQSTERLDFGQGTGHPKRNEAKSPGKGRAWSKGGS